MKRLAALVPNVLGVSPGQRVRIETWSRYLPEYGWTVDFYPFEDENLHRVLYQRGHSAAKALGLLRCYRRHFHRLRQMVPCDAILIFNEAALIGPALLERLASRMEVPLVYDIDDPRFIRYHSPTSGWASLLKFHGKTRSLIRLVDRVIAVNALLGEYVSRYNDAITVIPNCVDINVYQPGEPPSDTARLVWIGSGTTVANLLTIRPALGRLQQDFGTEVRVIGPAGIGIPGIEVDSRPWSAENEIVDLQDCHVGLLPLEDTPWNQWKFFFKAIQYMAVGLPVVARRMGSIDEVIQDGVNGFLVETQGEWYERLRALIENEGLRRQMGEAGRSTVSARYSIQAHVPTLASMLDEVVGAGAISHDHDSGTHVRKLAR